MGTVFALKPVVSAIIHTPCQLMQLCNENHAVQRQLGSYCREKQDFPGAGEEMVNMREYIPLLLLQRQPHRHFCFSGVPVSMCCCLQLKVSEVCVCLAFTGP